MVAILAVTGALALPAAGVIAGAGILVLAILWIWPGDGTTPEAVKIAQDVLWVWFTPLEPARFSLVATLGAGLVAWLCGITLYRGPNLPSPIALIYGGAAALTPLAALALAYLRLTHSDASLPFGVIAGLLAVAFLLPPLPSGNACPKRRQGLFISALGSWPRPRWLLWHLASSSSLIAAC